MPDDDRTSQVELKQRAGRKYGEWRDEIIMKVADSEEAAKIPFEEWYQLVDKIMSRQETVQAFLEILDYCRDNPHRVLPPGESRVFRRNFLQYASVDNKVLLLDKLRDPILYMETTTAHRVTARRKVSSLEDAF
jgi:hypothetical protein